jgi:DNA-directed RNA polymerase specialized sigma24 family protein
MIRDEAVVEHLLRDGEWFARIARALAADAAQQSNALELPRLPPESPEEAVACPGVRLAVLNEVLALPEPDRGAVILHFFDDWSFAAIAESTRRSEEMVRVRVRRGVGEVKAALRATFDPDGVLARGWLHRALLRHAGGHMGDFR